MHKKTLCLLMGALFLSSASHASEVDWTPFFKSWEDGCRQSEDFRAFIRGMARSEGDSDFFTLGEVVLPEGYAEAVGDLSLVHQEREYSHFSLEVKEGSYYGVGVNEIVAYLGNRTGIATFLVELDVPYEEVSNALSHVEYSMVEEYSYAYGAEFVKSRSTGNAMLMCDKSN